MIQRACEFKTFVSSSVHCLLLLFAVSLLGRVRRVGFSTAFPRLLRRPCVKSARYHGPPLGSHSAACGNETSFAAVCSGESGAHGASWDLWAEAVSGLAAAA